MKASVPPPLFEVQEEDHVEVINPTEEDSGSEFDIPKESDLSDVSSLGPDTASSGTLKGAVATSLFLSECKERMTKGVFRAATVTFEAIADSMRNVHMIDVTVVDCRKRWNSLGTRYRKEKKNAATSTWEHRFDMAVLKGEPKVFKKPRKGATPKKVITPKRATPKKFAPKKDKMTAASSG